MSEKCPTCKAPVLHEGDKYQFDSSRFHMDAVKKLSEISALRGEEECLKAALEGLECDAEWCGKSPHGTEGKRGYSDGKCQICTARKALNTDET